MNNTGHVTLSKIDLNKEHLSRKFSLASLVDLQMKNDGQAQKDKYMFPLNYELCIF